MDVRIAEELVEKARAEGLDLTGPNGLLAAVTKNIIEAALEAEMTEHLGYAKGDRAAAAGAGDGNHRNGTSKKTVQTGVGPVELAIPRDRAGAFEPAIVPKHARRVGGFDEAVVSLYAKVLTTGEIRDHLADLRCRGLARDDQQGHRCGRGRARRVAQPAPGPGVRGGHDRLHLRQDP
ncbi:hypothetical protein GCM10027447_39350 [Glycomyces halotolerans]